jgi:lipopolysaccharide/colanic/teichoic acid biosynthesis glycosyltransferase
MKRIFDIIFSLFALLITFPLVLIAVIFIKLDDYHSPVLFKQKRGGINMNYFSIYKFRTMRISSENKGKLTVGNDNRISKPGKWIRKFKIDELPQFINVLKGEMSVVGPRPEVEKYILLYNNEQKKIFRVKPGITDYASIAYFNENKLLGESNDAEKTYIEKIMPDKLKLNLKYIEEQSLLVDIKVIFKTILKIIR